jgi:hypothetical protein
MHFVTNFNHFALFLEFGALNSKDQLNFINAVSQENHGLTSNAISLIQNGKRNEI